MRALLTDKVAVITGGNSGIGFATAKRFIDEGAKVVIVGRREDAVKIAQSELGEKCIGLVGDVSKLDDLNTMFQKVKSNFGNIDILFANAGVALFAPVDLVDEHHFDKQFDINVKGLFFTVQKALPLMPNGSSILLNASIASSKGFAGASVYGATKAAVRSFARCWVTDLKERQIRVNVISPGPVETPIFSKMGSSKEELDDMAENFSQLIPLGRFGRPEEIAATAAFLASAEGSFINGIEINVDGGLAQV